MIDPNKQVEVKIQASRNDIYVVAYELKRISEKYASESMKLFEKGKCPGDKPMTADATANIAREFFSILDELDKN